MIILGCPNCDSKFKVKAEALGEKGRLVKCAKCQHKWHATADGTDAPTPVTVPKPTPAAAPKPAPVAEPTPAPVTEPALAAKPTTALEAMASGIFDEPAETAEEPETSSAPSIDTDETPPSGSDAKDIDDFSKLSAPSEPPPIPPSFTGKPSVQTKTKSPLKAWVILFILMIVIGISLFFFRKTIVEAYPASQKIFAMVGLGVDILGHGLEIKDPVPTQKISGDTVSLVIKGDITNTTGKIIAVPILQGALKDTQGTELHVWTFKANERTVLPGETVDYETEVISPPRSATGLSITFITEEEAMAVNEDEGHGEPENHDEAEDSHSEAPAPKEEDSN